MREIPSIRKNYIRNIDEKFRIIEDVQEELKNPRRIIREIKEPNELIQFLEKIDNKEFKTLPIFSKTRELFKSTLYFNMALTYFISVQEAFNDDIFEKISNEYPTIIYKRKGLDLLKNIEKVLPHLLSIKNFPGYLILKEFFYRRNSILHNNGRADTRYKNKTKGLIKHLKIKPKINLTTDEFQTKYLDIEYLYSTLRSYVIEISSKSIDHIRNNKQRHGKQPLTYPLLFYT